MKRAWQVVVVVTALVSSVTGCASFDSKTSIPTSEEVVGTWRYEDSEGHHATLILEAAGALTVTGVPAKCLSWDQSREDLDWEDVVDTSGTWEVENSDAGYYPNILINIEPSREKQAGTIAVFVDGTGAKMRLLMFYGDADEGLRVEFDRS